MGFVIPAAMQEGYQKIGITDLTISDAQVERNIAAACPPKTYSSVFVKTLTHNYETAKDPSIVRQSRVIELKPTNFEYTWNLFCLVFREAKIICISSAALGALGSPDQRDREELLAAFKRNYVFQIYVATDGSGKIDVEYDQDKKSLVVSTSCNIL
jgi:hypothetical protein